MNKYAAVSHAGSEKCSLKFEVSWFFHLPIGRSNMWRFRRELAKEEFS